MARSFTRAQIRTRARFHADLEGADVGVLDVRVNEILDVHKCDVYRELVKAGTPDYYSADFPITTAGGILQYPLPADFMRAVRVLRVLDPFRSVPITEIDGDVRGYFRPPSGPFNLTLEYIPGPPIWSADSDTFDGIAGYEELIAKMTAVDLLNKESTNAASLNAECARILAEIRKTAKRSSGSRAIQDRETEEGGDFFFAGGGTNSVRAYRLRAGNIELYERRIVP